MLMSAAAGTEASGRRWKFVRRKSNPTEPDDFVHLALPAAIFHPACAESLERRNRGSIKSGV